jgi:hypothetical protein
MPNVTFFFPVDQMPGEEVVACLTAESTEFCTGLLKAALDKVHIMYVAVQPGRGHPAFVEVRYRLEIFRSPDVMHAFMEALDTSILRNTGFTARIRCYGYAASVIQARN